MAQLVPHEQRHGTATGHGIGNDFARGPPVQFATAFQHGLQAADADGQQHKPGKVHLLGAAAKLLLGHVHQGQQQGNRTQRDVDVKNPRPRSRIGDVAAQRRAQHGPGHDAQAENGHAGPGLLGWKGLKQRGLRGRYQAAAAQPLHDAPEHQCAQRVGIAAHEGCKHEQHDGQRKVVAPPEPVGQPARYRQHDHVGHHVAGGNPSDLVERGAQGAHHVGHGDVDNAGVDQLQHTSQGHRHGNQQARTVDFVGCLDPPQRGGNRFQPNLSGW